MKLKLVLILFLMVFFSGFVLAERSYDPEIKKFYKIGRRAYLKGSSETAFLYYGKALEKAKAIDNSKQIALNAYFCAICMYEKKDYDKSLDFLEEALFELKKIKSNYSHINILQAKILKNQGKIKEAEKLAWEIVNAKVTKNSIADYFQANLILAEIAIDEKNLGKAESNIENAKKYLRRISNPGLRGWYEEISGKISYSKNNFKNASESFDKMSKYQQKAGSYYEMSQALENTGNSYEQLQKFNEAGENYFRAARSYFYSGCKEEALKVTEKYNKISDKVSEEIKRRFNSLIKEMSSSDKK